MADHIASASFMYTFLRARARAGLVLLAGTALLTLQGCSALQPYRVPVVQGNVVTREQAAVLRPGMSRLQVRDILGTPLLTSVFHAGRWDYVFTLRQQGKEPQSRRLTVYFKGDALERFETDELPSETEFVATLGSQQPSRQAVLEASPESLQAFPPPAPAPQAAPQPPLPASYPPLEPAGR